ncbi:MAG: flagellar motor protein PomA [Gammaproteobacteria bacterium]|nr:flagellar motor protein PomA [Gammaproteobacteria bacterium]
MDLATLLGLIGAIGIVLTAIVTGGEIGLFINCPSIMIVVGGTIGAVMMKFTLPQFLGAFKVAMRAFIFKLDKPEELIELTVEMAQEARKGGLLALENKETDNEFLAKGIQMMVDGHEPDVVKQTLMSDMRAAVDRHDIGRKIFRSIGDAAPAMGMIGTLIGLVQMLSNMSDPASIGPSMAVALLTTLYGAMIANIFAIPIADKLALRADEERMVKSMIIDSLVGIQEGRNPRVIEEILKTYLPSSKRNLPNEEVQAPQDD